MHDGTWDCEYIIFQQAPTIQNIFTSLLEV